MILDRKYASNSTYASLDFKIYHLAFEHNFSISKCFETETKSRASHNRYANSYLTLAKRISDDYHIEETDELYDISNYLFLKHYGIQIDKFLL